jgi:hypothetical protein
VFSEVVSVSSSAISLALFSVLIKRASPASSSTRISVRGSSEVSGFVSTAGSETGAAG